MAENEITTQAEMVEQAAENPVIPSGQDLIDATQSAIIDAATNVSEAIGVTSKNAMPENHNEPIYLEVHFWVGVAFVLAVLCIFKPIYKFAKAALQRRINKVVTDIDDAMNLRNEAQNLLADYERKFVNAKQEAADLLEKAHTNMQNIKKRETANLKVELQNREKEAERRIMAATEKTKAEINFSAGKISADLAQKAINRYLQNTDKSRLIDEAIAELDKFANKA